MAKNVCGIIIGEVRSPEEAGKISVAMKDCPYLVASGTASNRIYSVYIVPEERKWWLMIPETDPKEIGFEKASVYVTENLLYPENFIPKQVEKKTETAPCGAECQRCPLRQKYDCEGCPATVFYKPR